MLCLHITDKLTKSYYLKSWHISGGCAGFPLEIFKEIGQMGDKKNRNITAIKLSNYQYLKVMPLRKRTESGLQLTHLLPRQKWSQRTENQQLQVLLINESKFEMFESSVNNIYIGGRERNATVEFEIHPKWWNYEFRKALPYLSEPPGKHLIVRCLIFSITMTPDTL